MPDTAPMRLNGASFTRDKTGLIKIVVPWEVHAIEDCVLFTPDDPPLGLPIVDRAADEFAVGTWTLKLTYEGMGDDGKNEFDNAGTVEVELDTSMSKDPMESSPVFDFLKSKYGWNAAKKEFPEFMPAAAAGQQSPVSGQKKTPEKNDLFGSDGYLAIGAIFRLSYSTKNAPSDLMDGIGEVVEIPPGFNLLGIPVPRGRNWLKLAPKPVVRGNATKIVMEHMMSGPRKWNKDAYSFAQLHA